MWRCMFTLTVLPFVACTARATVDPPAPIPIEAEVALPNAVHWVRNSAEYPALVRQTFVLATDRIRTLAAGRDRGTWAVIVDVDESILDSSEYQKRLAAQGAPFDEDSWNAWVREIKAPPLPGAIAFLDTVSTLGGRVAIVTNRLEAVCDATRQNLRDVLARFDVVLCRPSGATDKNGRFAAVANGTAAPGLPPLAILMWIGDNIQDFPAMTQTIRDGDENAFSPFGRTWFVLPNPMYGSWLGNPRR